MFIEGRLSPTVSSSFRSEINPALKNISLLTELDSFGYVIYKHFTPNGVNVRSPRPTTGRAIVAWPSLTVGLLTPGRCRSRY